jgi:hypothetical protein
MAQTPTTIKWCKTHNRPIKRCQAGNVWGEDNECEKATINITYKQVDKPEQT